MSYGMLIDLNRCVGCGACAMACKQEHGTAANVSYCRVFQGEIGVYPNARMTSVPYACMQCVNPKCVEVCSMGATYRDVETGIVLVDDTKCDGCGACHEACPYGVREFNPADGDEDARYWGQAAEETPFEAVKAAGRVPGIVQKCQFCHDRLTAGRQPACVESCIVGARLFGEIDDEDGGLARSIAEREAVPLWSNLGTGPAVYYAGDVSVMGEAPDA